MRLADDEMNQLIVTINERFIIERDVSGNKIAALDLKSLKVKLHNSIPVITWSFVMVIVSFG